MLENTITGVALGFTAGAIPGPLLILLISETLRYGRNAGYRVAIAPIITDAPIILLVYLLYAQLAFMQQIIGAISLLGGIFLLYLSVELFRARPIDAATIEKNPASFRKALIANTLSPYPYIFWITVGFPIIYANENHSMSASIFISSFYVAMICAKFLFVIMTNHSRQFLGSQHYRLIYRLLAIVMLIFSGVLFLKSIPHLF